MVDDDDAAPDGATEADPAFRPLLEKCRNVLIYFSSALQEQILARFHEATPAGIRIHRELEALPSAVMIVDAADTILTWNPVAEHLFETPVAHAVGRKFRDIDVSDRVEGLRARMEEVKARQASARVDGVTFIRRNGEVVHANVTIAPLFEGTRFIGVLVGAEDATEYARLKDQMSWIAEQHATTIEELQSTNEELETTNEELQSTNEELETTVVELQAANAELAALNSELEDRGAELTRLDAYHRGFVNSLGEGVIGLDRAGVVRTWNHAAEQMWGLRSEQVLGRELVTLPLGEFVRRLRGAFAAMLEKGETQRVDGVPYSVPGAAELQATLRVAPVKDNAGKVLGGIATASPAGD